MVVIGTGAVPERTEAMPPAPPFGIEITTQPNQYVVQGVNDPASPHYMHGLQLLSAAYALDSGQPPEEGRPAGYHPGYMNTGFATPYFSENTRTVQFYDCLVDNDPDDQGCDNGMATLGRILMPTSVYQNESAACIRMVLGHELFHHIEFRYADNGGESGCSGVFGKTACEGQARAMQDKIYFDLDLTPEASCTAPYLGQVANYLDEPSMPLWSASYDAALWWTYLMEQYGTVTAEPQRGTDFLARWWMDAEEHIDSPNAWSITNRTIQLSQPTHSVTKAFHDFIITNVVKDLDIAGTSAAFRQRFSYRDEDPVPGRDNQQDYPPVAIAETLVVPNGGSREAAYSAAPYGTRYSSWNVASCPSGSILRYEVTPTQAFLAGGSGIVADTKSFYALIPTQGSNPGRPTFVYKAHTRDWTREIVQPLDRFERLITVIAGRYGDVQGIHRVTCDTEAHEADLPFATPANPVTPGPVGPGDHFTLDIRFPAVGTGPVRPLRAVDAEAISIGSAIPLQLMPGPRRDPTLAFTFRATIGGAAAPAPGDYDLTLDVGGRSTTFPSALRIGAVAPQVLLAIDTSASMAQPAGGGKLAAVRRAARDLLYGLPPEARLGMISFAGNGIEPDNDATLGAPLQALDAAHRERVRTAIDALVAGPARFTSIGDALALAVDEFERRAEPRQRRHVVLLSDGAEHDGPNWLDVDQDVIDAGIAVHTIAFGPQADQPLLARIAMATGGSYRYVDVTTVADESALGDALLAASAIALDRVVVANETISISANQTETLRVRVPHGLGEAPRHRFFAILDRTQVGSGGLEAFRVLRPDGVALVDGVAGARVHRVGDDVIVDAPLRVGEWQLQAIGTASSGSLQARVQAQVSASAGLRATPGLDRPLEQPATIGDTQIGDESVIQIALLLPAVQVVRDATARVFGPDGMAQAVRLNDDGAFGDVRADDGIFSGTFRRQTMGAPTAFPDEDTLPGLRGSYRADVVITVGGEDRPLEEISFVYHRIHWAVRGGTPLADGDADGLPDRFELRHTCLDSAVSDGSSDVDGDGRVSLFEFQEGSDPCDADTDGGGEDDGSELARGAQPLDPSDDALPRIAYAAIDAPGDEHEIEFDLVAGSLYGEYAHDPHFATIEVQRANNADGPFAIVALLAGDQARGRFTDQPPSIGQRYWYRLKARDAAGRSGAPSAVFSGVLRQDPARPLGSMTIEAGRPRTDRNALRLRLSLYQKNWSAANFRIAVDGLPIGSWQNFVANPIVNLPPVTTPRLSRIAVWLRDSEGHESRAYVDDIRRFPPNALGHVRLRAFVGSVRGANVAHGALAQIVGSEIESPGLAAADGTILLEGLLPGAYMIEVAVDGRPSVMREAVVTAGTTLDLGDVIVDPPASALFADGFE